jgi:hypothetical protein
MNIDELAERVSSLPLMLLRVLALMSEGLSNGQIAAKLGYNNRRVVGTYVFMINKELGLTKIQSAQEKRHLAVEAFRKSGAGPVKVQVSIKSKAIIASNAISISKIAAGRIRSLMEKGYKIDAVELILPIPGVAHRNRRIREPERG